jgi:MFS family permease
VLQPAFQFGLANTILFVFLPPFGQQAGLPRVGLFYLLYTAAAIAVRVGGGRLADRPGRRQIILPALAGQALGLVLCVGLQSTTVLVLVRLLNGTAQGFLFPATSTMAFELAPSGRRTGILAIFNMAVLLGGVVGATGFGWLAEALGYRPSFGLASALLGLARRSSGGVRGWRDRRPPVHLRGDRATTCPPCELSGSRRAPAGQFPSFGNTSRLLPGSAGIRQTPTSPRAKLPHKKRRLSDSTPGAFAIKVGGAFPSRAA